jgi:hypothetical protein
MDRYIEAQLMVRISGAENGQRIRMAFGDSPALAMRRDGHTL